MLMGWDWPVIKEVKNKEKMKECFKSSYYVIIAVVSNYIMLAKRPLERIFTSLLSTIRNFENNMDNRFK